MGRHEKMPTFEVSPIENLKHIYASIGSIIIIVDQYRKENEINALRLTLFICPLFFAVVVVEIAINFFLWNNVRHMIFHAYVDVHYTQLTITWP